MNLFIFSFCLFLKDLSFRPFLKSLQARGFSSYADSGFIGKEAVFFNTWSEVENVKAEKLSAFCNCVLGQLILEGRSNVEELLKNS